MRLIAVLGSGLLAAWLLAVLVLSHFDAIPPAVCGDAMTLPSIACRFAAMAVALLLIPFGAMLAGALVWWRTSRKAAATDVLPRR